MCLTTHQSDYLSAWLPINPFYLSVCTPSCLSTSFSTYLSVCLSVCMTIHQSALSAHLPIHPPDWIPVFIPTCLCLPLYPTVCLLVYSFVCMSVYPSDCLPVCLSTHLDVDSFCYRSYRAHWAPWWHPGSRSLRCEGWPPVGLGFGPWWEVGPPLHWEWMQSDTLVSEPLPHLQPESLPETAHPPAPAGAGSVSSSARS